MAAMSWTSPNTLNLGGTSATGTGALTSTDAPTADEGLFLGNVQSFEVTLEAESTRTLSAGGTLECWKKTSAGWCRMKELDITVSSGGAAGVSRRFTFLGPSAGIGIPVIARQGRIVFNPNGVTVSGGTTCTVYLDGLVGGRAV
jgi:hypothetical protein